jgi:hypothetical protein
VVDVGLHRIEALPGEGRYAVTFRAAGGAEQNAVAHLNENGLDVAPASLPATWQPGTEAFALLADAVAALDRARRAGTAPAELLDVDGGWDVMLGNVVLELGNIVACAAHGTMHLVDDLWTCPECGARATFAAD